MGRNNRIRRLVKPFRIDDGGKFRLKDHDPGGSNGLDSKEKAEKILAKSVERLAELQDMLYAQDKWAVLLIFQAMDAAGKDGAIKHVMSGVNPQGCQVYSFKAPTRRSWTTTSSGARALRLPERGRIGIFNRSYYEEVLVVRVHPEILAKQKLPPELVTKRIWKERFEDIAAYERYLARNGVVDPEVLPARVRRTSRRSASSSGSTTGEELEVLARGRGRARPLERLHGGLRGHDPRHRGAARAVVSWCPRTTSGSRGSSWPPRWRTRWRGWTSSTRR